LQDLVVGTKYFFVEPENSPEDLEDVRSNKSTTILLRKFIELLDGEYDSHIDLEKKSREMVASLGFSFKDLVHPLRLITTGMKVGPGLFEVLDALGKDIVTKRVSKFIEET
jgi:glutamyl/glutaminyl-tRNA synthetase